MLKTKIKERILALRIPQRLKVLLRPWPRLRNLVNTWPKLILLFVLAFIFLYYPMGALISENIDKNTNYEFHKNGNRSVTIDAMAFLIRREVYNKSWTPGLPFVFPAYMLDNMPSFQLGLMSSVSTLSKAFAARVDVPLKDEDSHLQQAAELLQYPGTIWMFSPNNKLVPAPSSNSQYRRARKQLQNYNQELATGRAILITKAEDLHYILNIVKKDFIKSARRLESQIREHSSDFYDGKADDVFYYEQGKIYSYYLLLKALGADYKEIILQHDIYQPLTKLLNTLETATKLNPMVVRNGETDSLTAPNHLAALGFYSGKAIITLQDMINTLAHPAAPIKERKNDYRDTTHPG